MTPEARAEVLASIEALRGPILEAIWELRTKSWPAVWPLDPGERRWVFISEIKDRFPDAPWKILRAALGVLRRDGEIRACLCGCRGDIELAYHPETGEWLA